jgi:hypothetical protein
MLEGAGHVLTDETPDVELCDLDRSAAPLPKEAEAPVVALTAGTPTGAPAGVLLPDATAEQLDAALRAVAAGLLVRSTATPELRGFAPAEDMPLLTARARDPRPDRRRPQQHVYGSAARDLRAHRQVSFGSIVQQAGRDQPSGSGGEGTARRRYRTITFIPPL